LFLADRNIAVYYCCVQGKDPIQGLDHQVSCHVQDPTVQMTSVVRTAWSAVVTVRSLTTHHYKSVNAVHRWLSIQCVHMQLSISD